MKTLTENQAISRARKYARKHNKDMFVFYDSEIHSWCCADEWYIESYYFGHTVRHVIEPSGTIH